MPQEESPKQSRQVEGGKPEAGNLDAAAQQAAQLEQSAPKVPDSALRVDDEIKTLEAAGLRDKLNRLQNLHTIRKIYLGLLFTLTVAWLGIVVLFVFFAGFRFREFTLSDSVLIAFITSTTVSVIGLFHFAAKWLYPSKD